MDLIERIADSLNTIPDLPARVRIGFMQPDGAIGVYPLPGSSKVDEDWAGNETRRMNYEVSIRTKDQQLANECMWRLSDYLAQLDDLPSADSSYQFEDIEQTGLPSVSEEDEQGYSVYMLDFYMEIIVHNRRDD